jgi:hypothetical protein
LGKLIQILTKEEIFIRNEGNKSEVIVNSLERFWGNEYFEGIVAKKTRC